MVALQTQQQKLLIGDGHPAYLDGNKSDTQWEGVFMWVMCVCVCVLYMSGWYDWNLCSLDRSVSKAHGQHPLIDSPGQGNENTTFHCSVCVCARARVRVSAQKSQKKKV